MNLAWHFVRDGELRDGRPVVPGQWLKHTGPLVLCKLGLHASPRAIDALSYAPGPDVCLVEVGGTVEHDEDKLVCSRRRVVWTADATEVLREFARMCALDVLHLWAAPQVVRDYLETGDESLRVAARAAASGAAMDASWRVADKAAERAAASSAAWAAESATTWAVANGAARDAASGTAWAAERDAVRAADKDAVRAAERAAERAAARDAVRATAWATARGTQNQVLESLLMELWAGRGKL